MRRRQSKLQKPSGRIVAFRSSQHLEAGFEQYRRERARLEMREIPRAEAAQTLVALALRSWAADHDGSQVARFLDDLDGAAREARLESATNAAQ